MRPWLSVAKDAEATAKRELTHGNFKGAIDETGDILESIDEALAALRRFKVQGTGRVDRQTKNRPAG